MFLDTADQNTDYRTNSVGFLIPVNRKQKKVSHAARTWDTRFNVVSSCISISACPAECERFLAQTRQTNDRYELPGRYQRTNYFGAVRMHIVSILVIHAYMIDA